MKISKLWLPIAFILTLGIARIAQADNESIAEYAETMNRIFIRNGTGVTVGPEDGHIAMTFGPFQMRGDGSAVAKVSRFDQALTPQWQEIEIFVRQNADGSNILSVKLAGAEKEATYFIRKVSDTHIKWTNDFVSPFKNAYTNDRWAIEFGVFDIYLDKQGRTVYTIDEKRCLLNNDYVAQHYTPSTTVSGQSFLRDMHGEQVLFKVTKIAQLIELGAAEAPISKHVYWKQTNP